MALTPNQKLVIRQMVLANGSDDYAAQVAASDDFALSELANFKTTRLAELAVDAEINVSTASAIAASQALFESV